MRVHVIMCGIHLVIERISSITSSINIIIKYKDDDNNNNHNNNEVQPTEQDHHWYQQGNDVQPKWLYNRGPDWIGTISSRIIRNNYINTNS